MRKKEALANYTVADFARLMIQGVGFTKLEKEIYDFQYDVNTSKNLLQRLNFAKERVEKSLELDEIFLFIFFPFGMIHRLSEQEFFDPSMEMKLGFKRKVNQYYLYSCIGLATYFTAAILVSAIF